MYDEDHEDQHFRWLASQKKMRYRAERANNRMKWVTLLAIGLLLGLAAGRTLFEKLAP